MSRPSKRHRLAAVLGSAAALAVALSMILPFLWMLSTSLMGDLEVYQFPPRFLPSHWRWENFPEALGLQPFGRFFLNTIIVSAVSVAGQLVFCSMARTPSHGSASAGATRCSGSTWRR